MMKSIRTKLISAILAGTVVFGSFGVPTAVMAHEYDEDYYGYYYYDEDGDLIYDDGWDDYISDYIAYKAMKHAYEEEHRYVDVTGICVSSTAVQLPAGGCYQITGYVKPDNANNQGVCYYSTNPMIATVDGNGVIRAITPGTCYIVSKSSEGGYEAYTSMTVLPATTMLPVVK